MRGVLLFHNYLYSLVQSLWGKNRCVLVGWAAYEGGSRVAVDPRTGVLRKATVAVDPACRLSGCWAKASRPDSMEGATVATKLELGMPDNL